MDGPRTVYLHIQGMGEFVAQTPDADDAPIVRLAKLSRFKVTRAGIEVTVVDGYAHGILPADGSYLSVHRIWIVQMGDVPDGPLRDACALAWSPILLAHTGDIPRVPIEGAG